jgi:hypothetical protein
MLEGGECTPKQVAAFCGFANADTLRRPFARLLGVTPAEYRKLHGAISAHDRGTISVTREDRGKENCLQNRSEKRHFRVCVTARGRTGQLRHSRKRFAFQFGLEPAFAGRLL